MNYNKEQTDHRSYQTYRLFLVGLLLFYFYNCHLTDRVSSFFLSYKAVALLIEHIVQRLDGQVRTAECWRDLSRVIRDDSLNSSIKTGSKQEQPNKQDDNVDDRPDGSECTSEELTLVHAVVCDGKEDEAKEAVEGGSKNGQEVTHAWDNLTEDEADAPDGGDDQDPDTPAEDGMAVCVSRCLHDAGVDVFGADVGVDDADDEGWHDDEGEGSLLVGFWAQAAESWRGRVLTQVSESDGRWDNEQECRDTGQHGEGLREVLRPLHLGDEAWEEDLRHPEEGDVEDSVDAADPSRSR